MGSVLGYACERQISKLEDEIETFHFYTPKLVLEMLIKNRIDVAVLGKRQGKYLLSRDFPEYKDKYHFIEPPIVLLDQHIGFVKKENPPIVEAFNRGLKTILNNGIVDKILLKHDIK